MELPKDLWEWVGFWEVLQQEARPGETIVETFIRLFKGDCHGLRP